MKKNMNNIIKRSSAFLLTVSLCFSVSSCNKNKDNDKSDLDDIDVPNMETTQIGSSLGKDEKIYKDETVYAICDAKGSVNKVIVSDWIKNNTSLKINDMSSLNNIVNLKGEETFTKNESNVEWNANGNDIYYQGESSDELPVNVEVTYYLNNQEVDPSSLSGASGDLKIKFNYNSNAKVINGKEIYYPFFMVSAFLIDNTVASNIEVSNGKVINDGTHSFVVGYGVPGILESLGITQDIFDIAPSTFEVTANVKDFKLASTITVAVNNLFDSNLITQIDPSKTPEEIMTSTQTIITKLESVMASASDYKTELNDMLNLVQTKLIAGLNALYSGLVELEASLKSLATVANGVYVKLPSLKQNLQVCLANDQALQAYLTQNAANLVKGDTQEEVEAAQAEYKKQMTYVATNIAIEQALIGQLTESETLNYEALTLADAVKLLTNLSVADAKLAAAINGYDDEEGNHHEGLKDLVDYFNDPAVVAKLNKLGLEANQILDELIKVNTSYTNLVNATGIDTDNIVANIASLVSLSKGYINFSGITSDMDGNVKFIIKTAEI